ncbi:unnamed protein product [Linum trigynum]|uniref:Uncharacterized protein n=1 Tax=Linum trigynum TaxID=586398 RepID=A0AAV2F7R9_9ROSI
MEKAKHLVSTVEGDYMKIIPTKATMIVIPAMIIKKEAEVIINPFHHMKKKSKYDFHAGSGSYHNYHYRDDVGAFHDLDEMEDVLPGPFGNSEDEERKVMLVQTASTLLKVSMIQSLL